MLMYMLLWTAVLPLTCRPVKLAFASFTVHQLEQLTHIQAKAVSAAIMTATASRKLAKQGKNLGSS